MTKVKFHCKFFKYIFLFCCLAGYGIVYGQVKADCTPADKEIFERYISYITPYRDLPLNEVIILSAKYFSDVPYVAYTLEKEPERLVVNLMEMDCTTFVETVLALSRSVKGKNLSFDSFVNNLQQVRYKEGRIDDYASRLHYMSEWIYDNEKAGIIKDVTRQIGGIPFPVNISFMSQHPDSYRQLAADPALLGKIREIEKQVNHRKDTYYYIPKQEAQKSLDKLQNGDIVLFTTSIEGLDVTHVGFIFKEKAKTTFIHASTSGKRVLVNEAPLVDYMNRIKSNTGMIILRPQPVS